jgi:hypothetical protein
MLFGRIFRIIFVDPKITNLKISSRELNLQFPELEKTANINAFIGKFTVVE